MSSTNVFANDGFGWYCIRCAQLAENGGSGPRLMKEGEAESKEPEMSEIARAKWSDKSRTILLCPLCGLMEPVAG